MPVLSTKKENVLIIKSRPGLRGGVGVGGGDGCAKAEVIRDMALNKRLIKWTCSFYKCLRGLLL